MDYLISLAFAIAIIAYPLRNMQAPISPPLPHVGAAHQVIQADVEEVGDSYEAFHIRGPLLQFVALVRPKTDPQFGSDFFLCHISFCSQQSDTFMKFHKLPLDIRKLRIYNKDAQFANVL